MSHSALGINYTNTIQLSFSLLWLRFEVPHIQKAYILNTWFEIGSTLLKGHWVWRTLIH